ncbi:hypothetical protein K439DRAFT_1660894 [Ramaria rubella]|nr:hypothetical protein K439DRAFT_1660894 [Ramaria rubella]
MSSSTKRHFGDMSPNSSHTSEPTPKFQRLDTVRLSMSEEQHVEQDQQLLKARVINLIPEQLDEELAATILSHIIKNARDHMNQVSLSEVEKLVQTEDGLMEELQDAWSNKSFSRIRSLRILQNPVLDRRPVVTPPPTTNYNVQDSPPTISNKINTFRKALKAQLKNFIVEGERAIPRWNTKDKGTFDDHVRALRIPMLKGQPSLLLHDLGELAANDEENVSLLFATSGSEKIFCNVSGSGKTRMLLQGLYRTWGFYFVCQVDFNGIGSRDIATAISRLSKTQGWTEPLPERRSAALLASNDNDLIAQAQFKSVLLARLIILNLFLTICEEHQGITDEAKGLWTILQVDPTNFGHSYDIFNDLFQLLEGITNSDLHERFSNELRAANDRLRSRLVCVVDEAQAAARSHEEAFISSFETSSPQSRPVLKSLSKFMHSCDFQVILTGTDISIDQIGTAIVSTSLKNPEFQFFHETGSLDDVKNHAAYMERYLPASLLQGEAGKQLRRRSWHWLRGRYRFTAVFVMLLLEDGGRSPHTILDYLVHHITGYWPNDGMDEWRKQEPAKTPVIHVKIIYNVEQLQQHAYLLKDASRIVFRYMIGRNVPASNEYPKTWVELGFARFLDNIVSINENLAILSLARWLEEQRGFTLKDFLNDAVNDSTRPQIRGYRFEDVITFHLYSAFQDFVELKKAFNFICPVPEWASQRARLITFTRGEDREYQWAGVNSRRLGKPQLSTAPMAVGSSTADHEAVVSWLEDQKYIPIFLPTDLMGPDHVLLMELEDGRHVWLVIQEKFVDYVLATAKLKAAVKTVTPPFFEGHPPGIKACERAVMSNLRDNLQTDTQDAMNDVPNPVPGNPPVLRVITNVCGVKTEELSADNGPLAIMDLKHLQSTTWNGVVGILGAALPD